MRLVVALIYIIVTLIVRIGSYPFKVLISQHPFNDRIKELINIYASSFPEREDNLTFADLDIYRHSICKWSRLFKCYDIILAYSTDPRIPMIAGVRYVAFEHGTIREIPYQQTSEGRATALSYRLADHVFVTNADCLESADKLSPQKYTMINHPYDEDHWMGVSDWKVLQKKLCKILDSELLFFFPTRHDWIPDTGYADKANDVFLRAFCMLRNKGFSVGLVCANWGSNVHESKELLNKMGCSPYVLWKEPMGTVAFERMAMACCFVVDQFKLGAFGGIVFKAMAVGSPIITYLDPKKVMKQYPEIPPVVNCKTEREIVDQVSILATDRDRLTSIGELSRAWIKKYHSKKDTVNLQIDCFRKLDANVAQFTPTEGVWNERYNSKGVGHNYG